LALHEKEIDQDSAFSINVDFPYIVLMRIYRLISGIERMIAYPTTIRAATPVRLASVATALLIYSSFPCSLSDAARAHENGEENLKLERRKP
jgi:hypothetical protein